MIETKLLETLARLLQITYLSDLHTVAHEDLSRAVQQIDQYIYTLDQWSYAFSYILDEDVCLKQYSEINDVLEEYVTI